MKLGERKAQTRLGAPCALGHSGLRYVSNNGCVDCIAAREMRYRASPGGQSKKRAAYEREKAERARLRAQRPA